MNTHSIIPPSSAGIWGKSDGCTAWVLMTQQYPETKDNPEAAEGDASHEMAAELIIDRTRGFHGTLFKNFEGRAASNGIMFNDEMFDAAELYADDVGMIMREVGVFGGPNIGVEQRIIAKSIHDLSYGTTDCFIYDAKNNVLYIWDYKFGYEIVEAFENWQSINYLAGLFEQLQINGILDQKTVVHIRIAQPRAIHREGSIREWKIRASDLRGYFNILSGNAHEALSDNAIMRTGNHCKHCSARHACTAAIQGGMSLYETAMKPTSMILPPAALGVQLTIVKRARKQLELLETGYEEQVKGLIKSGTRVPAWIIEQGLGRQAWTKPVKEVVMLGDLLKIDLRKPDEVVTPKQAIKLGIDETVIKQYSNTPRTGLKLVPDNGSKAKQIFGDI